MSTFSGNWGTFSKNPTELLLPFITKLFIRKLGHNISGNRDKISGNRDAFLGSVDTFREIGLQFRETGMHFWKTGGDPFLDFFVISGLKFQ